MSIRLEEVPFEFDGKTFLLRCNMAVLEDVQDAHGGSLDEVLELPPTATVLEFLAAMLNDYADEQGWPERYTPKALRRKLNMAMIRDADVMGLVTRAIFVEPTPKAADPAPVPNREPGNPGN